MGKVGRCALGLEHTLVLDNDSVWFYGYNKDGRLGSNDIRKISIYPRKGNIKNIEQVAAGADTSLFLDGNGVVWGCGNNDSGQLGLKKEFLEICKLTKINSLPKISSIFAANCFSIFLDESGSVWTTGMNDEGQLGLGDYKNRYGPTKIEGLPTIKQISAGDDHSLFLDALGHVWSCGGNEEGQLGLGDYEKRPKPERSLRNKFKAIAGGNYFSLFLDDSGNAWACGSNEWGKLGIGKDEITNTPKQIVSIQDISSITTGFDSSMFLDQDGCIYTCGENSKGQLGLGDKRTRYKPNKVRNIPKIAEIASCSQAGGSFLVVDEEGYLWASGNNAYGQLGLGDTEKRLDFTKIKSIPALWGNLVKEADNKADIFKQLVKQQNSKMKDRILATFDPAVIKQKDKVKEMIISGVIPMVDWSVQWAPIHEKTQELCQSINKHNETLEQKHKDLDKLKEEIESLENELEDTCDEQEVLEFFDELLSSIIEVEKEINSTLEEKFKKGTGAEFSLDEVSLFLNYCGLEELVEFKRENQLDGEIFMESISDVSVMGIKDTLFKKKLKFYLKVFEAGLMLQKEILNESVIWRHRSVDKTLAILKEWEIELDEDLIREKDVSICQLIFMKNKHLREVFGFTAKEAVSITRKLHKHRIKFEEFLGKNERSKK